MRIFEQISHFSLSNFSNFETLRNFKISLSNLHYNIQLLSFFGANLWFSSEVLIQYLTIFHIFSISSTRVWEFWQKFLDIYFRFFIFFITFATFWANFTFFSQIYINSIILLVFFLLFSKLSMEAGDFWTEILDFHFSYKVYNILLNFFWVLRKKIYANHGIYSEIVFFLKFTHYTIRAG